MRLFSWASTAALLGCGTDEGDAAGSGRRVLVLGGGLAGLSAAWELQQHGFEVTVLEARDRVGGRVWTLREGFEDGQYAEIGAVRIPDSHDRTLAYAEALGLELTEFPDGEPLYFIDGERFMHAEGEAWPVPGLAANEQTASLGELWEQYVASAFEAFGDPRADEFPKPGIVEQWDGVVYTDFLKQQGASDAFLKLYASDNGSEVYTIGTLAWMAAEVADQAWSSTFHIRGGNDLLPRGVAEQIGEENIRLSHQVLEIRHGAVTVSVIAQHDGETVELEADYLVCTIPFSVLRDVVISPGFSDDKMQVIDELFMMNAGRGYIQTASRFWEAEGIGGLKIAKTDTPVERVWNLSPVQEPGSAKGMIVSYTQDRNADAYCELPPSEREAYTLEHLAAFFPEIEAETLVFFHYCWKEDPWVKGAWTDFLPGQWWMFDVARRVEGRVHFAGEHTSVWAGWMQGAIESGQRAAQEILDRVGVED